MTIIGKTIVGIILLGVIGGGAWYYQTSQKEEATVESTGGAMVAATTTNNAMTGKKIPFSEFAKNPNGSYKCTVNQSINNTDSTGTVYLNNGMVRGEFTTTMGGQTINSTFIIRDGYNYVWMTGPASMAFKIKIPAGGASATTTASTQGSYAFNADTVGDYNCESWVADGATFTVPTTIRFKEMN